MLYQLSEEELMIKQTARKIAEEKIIPVRDKYDKSGEFPYEIVKVMAETDLFRVFIPPEYDGLGMGIFALCLAVEELSWGCAGIALSLAGTALGTFPIILFGSEKIKRKVLPEIAKGKIASFCLTEPEAGSDALSIKTTAIKKDGGYVINGVKQFITNAHVADFYSVFALTDPKKGPRGMSAFLVEKGTKGLKLGKKEDKLGIRASPTGEVIFEDVFVPEENLIGKEGQGLFVATHTFLYTRPGVAAQAIGIAQAALDAAALYSMQRKQFGQPISGFQAIQHRLAEMAMKIEAARALTYQVARAIDRGEKPEKESAMAKCFASDVAMSVTIEAVQIFGGYGYIKEYPVEKMMRDAKITQIYEGTNEIMKNIIASELLKETRRKMKV
ncbi:MAG: acyl-CoA dehydrogenase family protein [candidate division WOR-3 bacterium]